MIRDRLVVGIRDHTLSERLQLDVALTLDKAKKMVRQREAVHEQGRELKGSGESSTLEAVYSGRNKKVPKKGGNGKPRPPRPGKPPQKECSRCGKGPHPLEKCPAKEAVCHRCEKKGHYSSTSWTWDSPQQQAFEKVKQELVNPSVLALYDPDADTNISADASSYGLGAVLMQKDESSWKAVAFASRAMNETEQWYAQIEKEALATTWACEKFSCYILGKRFGVETDHKPLVPLLGTKNLDSLPPRILRFRLRMDRFDYHITHVPGKELYTADTLSRAPLLNETSDSKLQEEANLLMEMCISHLPASPKRLDEYGKAQGADHVCSTIVNYCRNGWPDKRATDAALRPFWRSRGELTLGNGLLLYGNRIVVPKPMQRETLQKLHEGHQGIQQCSLRASTSVWWPGLSQHLNNLVEKCPECAKQATPRSEPLLSTKLPDFPWQRVGTDLFMLNGATYLLVVDYFSRYPEVVIL